MEIDLDKLYKVREAALILGYHTDTLRDWHERGILIPETITPYGHRRYSGKQLIEFLERLKNNG